MRLGINIDHVATLRNARGGREPSVEEAAAASVRGGADQITVHLREDRRHIKDQDVQALRESLTVDLNLEMAATDEMVQIACRIQPAQVTLVPEKREEKTTEGGLDLKTHFDALSAQVKKIKQHNIPVVLFIESDLEMVRLSHQLEVDGIEIHTGTYANAVTPEDRQQEIEAIQRASTLAKERNLLVHAGHGLNFENVFPIAEIAEIRELNIGHSIVSRAVFNGLEKTVGEMKSLISKRRLHYGSHVS